MDHACSNPASAELAIVQRGQGITMLGFKNTSIIVARWQGIKTDKFK